MKDLDGAAGKEKKEIKCVLCSKIKEGKKRFNEHHIDYDRDITITLCFNCHQMVHGRNSWHNAFEKKYGKDKGFYEFAKKFMEVYDEKIKEVKG